MSGRTTLRVAEALSLTVLAAGLVTVTVRVGTAPHSQASRPVPTPTASTAPVSPPAMAEPPTAPGQAIEQVAASAASVPVPRLRHLDPPDAVVSLSTAPSASALRRLADRSGVLTVSALTVGRVHVSDGHGRSLDLRVAAAAPGPLRGLTPEVSARSTSLWRSVAAGGLVVGFGPGHDLRSDLGHQLEVTASGSSPTQRHRAVRLGALATLGLPGVQAVVKSSEAASLGLRQSEVMVAAPQDSLAALSADIHEALGQRASINLVRPLPADQSVASPVALRRVPADYLELYRRAAVTCPGLSWTVLAGIGTVETGNGTDVHTSSAGAEGPMQFLPSTWARWGVDADGLGSANIDDPVDAVFSAARYLCAAGAGRGGNSLDQAVFAYNHAWWYVREVLDLARSYV